MSKTLRLHAQANGKGVMQTMKNELAYRVVRNVKQFENVGTGFSPSLRTPGEKTQNEIIFNSDDICREEEHFFKITVSNSDLLNNPTFYQGPFTLIDEIVCEVDDSKQKIEIKGLEFILELLSEELKAKGLELYEYMEAFRNEHDTFNGETVANGAPVVFYYPLWFIISFLKKKISNEFISKIKFDIRFTPQGADEKASCKICKSNTNVNAYTKANIIFSDILYVRTYTLIKDQRLDTKPNLNAIMLYPQCETAVVPVSWNNVGVDYYDFKLSDITRRKDIQNVCAYIRIIPTTYNDANACKKFSGHNYILWKWRELNGKDRSLDYTKDEHLLKLHEMELYKNQHNNKRLPAEVWKNTTELNDYYLNRTHIRFDNNETEDNSVILNTVSTIKDDNWQIRFVCNSALGANCELVIIVNYYEYLGWNDKNQLIAVE